MQATPLHLTEISRRISLKKEVRIIYSAGKQIVDNLPYATKELMWKSVRGEIKAGVSCDFDKTLVPTDEIKREFYILGGRDEVSDTSDNVGNIFPLSGLLMLEMPFSIISGNTTEYVDARCAEPVRNYILDSPYRASIEFYSTYALNGGYITLFDSSGSENTLSMEEYNHSKRMPKDLADELSNVMAEEVCKIITGPLTHPLTIRAGRTVTQVFSPILEKRAGVQICLVGVPPEDRMELIDKIRVRLNPQFSSLLSVQPGGQHTVDGSMASLQKPCAGKDFMERFNLDHIFYLGDSVYKKDDKEGNDFSMVHNPNTTVLAVNDHKEEVPIYENVHWIGAGPFASKNWLTWYFLERASFIYNQDQSSQEKIWNILKYVDYCDES